MQLKEYFLCRSFYTLQSIACMLCIAFSSWKPIPTDQDINDVTDERKTPEIEFIFTRMGRVSQILLLI